MKFKLFLLVCISLISVSITAQDTPEPADKIMAEAYSVAAKDGKNVLVIFHASWCGWCKKFEASITDPTCKDYFNKNFVIVHLDILERADKKNLENPGATELFNKYGGAGGGIPFFLIFDKKGTLLADSKINLPEMQLIKHLRILDVLQADEEVAEFIKILSKTSKINPSEITAVSERFKKNR